MEKMKINDFSAPNQEKINRLSVLKNKGEESLKKINIDPKEYLQYTELMRQADAPIGQAWGVLDYLDGVIITPTEAVEAWSAVKNIFDRIEIDKYDKNTGQAILIEMKQLVTDCLSSLQDLVQQYDGQTITEPIKLPANLLMIKNRINELKKDFGELPAYLTYRQVGIYDINPADIPDGIWFREKQSTN
ncbi:MAG: hypothetical protein ACOZAJ_01370 [Patescibacteria group bacterium]